MSIKRILYVLTNEISSDKKELSLLLALSAGQDSTCLAFFIIMYQKLLYSEKQIQVGIIYCQHNWNTDSLNKANYLDSWLTLLKKSCNPTSPR